LPRLPPGQTRVCARRDGSWSGARARAPV